MPSLPYNLFAVQSEIILPKFSCFQYSLAEEKYYEEYVQKQSDSNKNDNNDSQNLSPSSNSQVFSVPINDENNLDLRLSFTNDFLNLHSGKKSEAGNVIHDNIISFRETLFYENSIKNGINTPDELATNELPIDESDNEVLNNANANQNPDELHLEGKIIVDGNSKESLSHTILSQANTPLKTKIKNLKEKKIAVTKKLKKPYAHVPKRNIQKTNARQTSIHQKNAPIKNKKGGKKRGPYATKIKYDEMINQLKPWLVRRMQMFKKGTWESCGYKKKRKNTITASNKKLTKKQKKELKRLDAAQSTFLAYCASNKSKLPLSHFEKGTFRSFENYVTNNLKFNNEPNDRADGEKAQKGNPDSKSVTQTPQAWEALYQYLQITPRPMLN